MSRVKAIYRAAAGSFRTRTVTRSGKRPNFLLNNADSQVHVINGKAVFPRTESIPLQDWHHLQTQTRPVPPRYIEGRMVFIEDNCYWPIDYRPLSSHAQKAKDCLLFYQETLQASRSESAAKISGTVQDKNILLACSIVCIIGVVLIFGQFAVQKFGEFGREAIQVAGVGG